MYQNICRCITLYSLLVKDDFERENWRFWIFGGGEKKETIAFMQMISWKVSNGFLFI